MPIRSEFASAANSGNEVLLGSETLGIEPMHTGWGGRGTTATQEAKTWMKPPGGLNFLAANALATSPYWPANKPSGERELGC